MEYRVDQKNFTFWSSDGDPSARFVTEVAILGMGWPDFGVKVVARRYAHTAQIGYYFGYFPDYMNRELLLRFGRRMAERDTAWL